MDRRPPIGAKTCSVGPEAAAEYVDVSGLASRARIPCPVLASAAVVAAVRALVAANPEDNPPGSEPLWALLVPFAWLTRRMRQGTTLGFRLGRPPDRLALRAPFLTRSDVGDCWILELDPEP